MILINLQMNKICPKAKIECFTFTAHFAAYIFALFAVQKDQTKHHPFLYFDFKGFLSKLNI